MASKQKLDTKRFGINLKQQMAKHKMRATDLAVKVSKTRRTIDDWLDGQALPKRGTLAKLEEIFNLSPKTLLDGVIDSESQLTLRTYDDFADQLMQALSRTNSHLHHTNLSADYVIPKPRQAEFYDQLDRRVKNGEIEYHRVEVIRTLPMLEDVLERLQRFDYDGYVQRVFLTPHFLFPAINSFMFDGREHFMGGFHSAAQTPCVGKLLHASGTTMQVFLSAWWERVMQESVPINPTREINWKTVCLAASGMCWHFDATSGDMTFQNEMWNRVCLLIEKFGGIVELETPQKMVQLQLTD